MQEQREGYLKIIIDTEKDQWTVERVFRQSMGVSRSLLRRAKREENILLNGSRVNSNTRVRKGDCLELGINRQPSQVIPEQLALEILYEDRDLLAVNKPANMLVHPLTNQATGTLANGIVYHWQQHGEQDLVRLVHRLDRDTSGIVLVAKNAYIHQQLQQQMHREQFVRRYLAVVEGEPVPSKGIINAPIGLAPDSIIQRMVTPLGKPAISHYWVLRTWKQYSLICLELKTGRTHQVRIHMSYLGHPLLGDSLYGGQQLAIQRQALHCAYLSFYHPVTGRPTQLACPLPPDLKGLFTRH